MEICVEVHRFTLDSATQYPRDPGSPDNGFTWNLNDHPAFRFGDEGHPESSSAMTNMTRKMPRDTNRPPSKDPLRW